MATPWADKFVAFPLYLGQVFVAILVRTESIIELYRVHSFELFSCFHDAKVARFLKLVRSKRLTLYPLYGFLAAFYLHKGVAVPTGELAV